jgi:hypothetical protein
MNTHVLHVRNAPGGVTYNAIAIGTTSVKLATPPSAVVTGVTCLESDKSVIFVLGSSQLEFGEGVSAN